MFKAFVIDARDGDRTAEVRTLESADLPEADTHLEVLFSSLNYKDALAVTGKGKIIRGEHPMVPGIDLVGRVVSSASDRFDAGDLVIGTGWQLGEVVWGGYTQEARVASEKLVSLPDDLTPRAAMTIGTAGFTAMLAVMNLQEHDTTPDDGEVLVTGASGGAGSLAVALLDALGYTIAASTGSEDAHDYLRDLGADRIVPRSDFDQGPKRPMEKGLWAGAIDAVGGQTLATVIAQMKRRTSIAAFGNTGGFDLNTTVFPFILRGIKLLGIDSNTCPNPRRRTAWVHLADLLDGDTLEYVTAGTIGLNELPDASQDVLRGAVRGRIVVDLSA